MNYPHNLVVVRDTFASPEEGNTDWNQPVAEVPTLETHVRGFLQSRSGQEVRQANDAGAVGSTHVAYLPAGTDIQASDRVRFGTETYEVRLVADGRGLTRTAYRRADLYLVSG